MTIRLLKADKVAEILDVSVQRVYELTRERRIPFVQLGERQYRYSEAALSTWLEDGGSIGQSNGNSDDNQCSIRFR
jgi:excisionase family DNA binding protein